MFHNRRGVFLYKIILFPQQIDEHIVFKYA